jgi:hypothetical protein
MSEVKTEKLSPRVTSLQLGDSGDTFDVPSGAEIDIASGATLDVNGTVDFTGATVSGLTTGSLVKITSQTNNSEVASWDFTDVFTSTYDAYMIVMSGLNTTGNSCAWYFYLGNSDLSSTRNIHWQTNRVMSTYIYYHGAENDSKYQFVQDTASGVLAGVTSGVIWVHNPHTDTLPTKMTHHVETYDNGAIGTYCSQTGGAMATSATSDVSFRLDTQLGNIGSTSVTQRVTVLGVAH